MADEHIIKKYANRRLYDVAAKKHVTLEDIRRRVSRGERVRVYDDKSGTDITRQILLQILSDQEQRDEPILSVTLLESLIRFYGSGMQSLMTRYLESSIAAFLEQQASFQERFNDLVGKSPLASFAKMAQSNAEQVQALQRQFLDALNPFSSAREAAANDDKENDDK